MPSGSTNWPSARRTATALSTTRRSPTSSPRGSTQHAVSEKFADAYLLEARYCYQRWGADGKVAQLDQLYPHLKRGIVDLTPTSTILAPAELLDLATVIKVSQAVSGEMVLEKLIDSLMRTAIEHAGAERGLLILPRGDQLRIAAEAATGGDNVTSAPEESVTAAGYRNRSCVTSCARRRT